MYGMTEEITQMELHGMEISKYWRVINYGMV